MIKSFVNKNANDWDLHIGILMAAYRSTVHPATGYSPNMLMLGRRLLYPITNYIPFPNCNESMEVETYVSKMRSKLEEIYQLAREHLRSSAEELGIQSSNSNCIIKSANPYFVKLGIDTSCDATYKDQSYIITEVVESIIEIREDSGEFNFTDNSCQTEETQAG
ncbi:unnamed protein product [Mytilus edulis]|uniref:Integrase catalytic domain-containing protein n=1 Tax=Mytilus edulis TaxID=6550 RepID=A0A8S3S7F1_MYTED|nr:unnamed protein product [Mytilus edulis]